MKKILLISPFYNGLYRYERPLYEELTKEYGDEYIFHHLGNPQMTFDINTIELVVNDLVDKIIKLNPDIIHYNYGTYDVEQLLPFYLAKKGFKCKTILTYHSLQLDLFKKIGIPELDEAANEYMGKMDAYVFFTEYGKKTFYQKYPNSSMKNIIAFHPATHLDEKLSNDEKEKYFAKYGLDKKSKFATLLGYPSHWKDTRPVIKLVKNFPNINFVIAGPWWKEKIEKENEDFVIDNYKNLTVINEEINVEEFNFLLDLGIGIFPYHYFKSFQGSGLLPNYLYRGINTIINDFEPLKEYKNDGVDFYDDDKLFDAFEKCIANPVTKKDLRFSYSEHAKNIIYLYREV